MEHRAEQLREEIDRLMENIGPDLTSRVGQYQTEKQQHDTEPELAAVPPELRKDYARVFHLKAEIEDLKALGAQADYAHQFHAQAAEAFRNLRDRFEAKEAT